MDGTSHDYTHYVENAKISFFDTCNSFSEHYTIPKIWLRKIKISANFVLGLNFILDFLCGISISRDYVHFYKKVTMTSVQKKN